MTTKHKIKILVKKKLAMDSERWGSVFGLSCRYSYLSWLFINRFLNRPTARADKWRLFIFISRESKWGTLKSAGNPRCAVPAESHSICTDRRRPGPAASLQVSPTSDTCQSVAILMNRPHCSFAKTANVRCNVENSLIQLLRKFVKLMHFLRCFSIQQSL